MHLKEDNDNYYHNFLDNIKRHLPDFITEFDSEDIYPIAFEFSNYLIDNYEDEIILEKCINIINEALEKGRSLTEDLIVLQVFQLLYEDKKKHKDFESYLMGDKKALYIKHYKLWKQSIR